MPFPWNQTAPLRSDNRITNPVRTNRKMALELLQHQQSAQAMTATPSSCTVVFVIHLRVAFDHPPPTHFLRTASEASSRLVHHASPQVISVLLPPRRSLRWSARPHCHPGAPPPTPLARRANSSRRIGGNSWRTTCRGSPKEHSIPITELLQRLSPEPPTAHLTLRVIGSS